MHAHRQGMLFDSLKDVHACLQLVPGEIDLVCKPDIKYAYEPAQQIKVRTCLWYPLHSRELSALL